jgi:uncharacterized protein
MKELGKINSLLINRFTPNGAYLALRDGGEVLLPKSYLSGNEKESEEIEVFVYTDSEDRPVAVTDRPAALLDEFAVMEVKEITQFGAFMDWGLRKDLFVPKAEMKVPMEVDKKYLVRVCKDYQTNRLIGVSKYEEFLSLDLQGFEVGQDYQGLIFDETELGFKVLIEMSFEGLLYKNEVFEKIKVGDWAKVFIKKVREDHKLDLSLHPAGREKYDEGAEKILQVLEKDKFLPLHDQSTPEEIKKVLGMSKKHFKQCIGQLYKARKIKLVENGIQLL